MYVVLCANSFLKFTKFGRQTKSTQNPLKIDPQGVPEASGGPKCASRASREHPRDPSGCPKSDPRSARHDPRVPRRAPGASQERPSASQSEFQMASGAHPRAKSGFCCNRVLVYTGTRFGGVEAPKPRNKTRRDGRIGDKRRQEVTEQDGTREGNG